MFSPFANMFITKNLEFSKIQIPYLLHTVAISRIGQDLGKILNNYISTQLVER